MATPEEMAASMRQNIEDKTGKSFSAWKAIIDKEKVEKHGQIIKFLKSKHGVTHGFANLIAHDYLNSEDQPTTDLIAAQYSGPKQNLKKIYDKLIKKISAFGSVDISPKKSYVSLRRSKQFAIIQPSTKSRIDVGINLKSEPTTDRLETSGSFNAMVSHRVRLTDVSEVDDELIEWLKKAYSSA